MPEEMHLNFNSHLNLYPKFVLKYGTGTETELQTETKLCSDDLEFSSKMNEENMHSLPERIEELDSSQHVIVKLEVEEDPLLPTQEKCDFIRPKKRRNRQKPKGRVCHICGSKVLNLKLHISTKHSDERPFKCPQCDADFKTKALLKLHTQTHSSERSFLCDQCGKAYKTRPSLNEHNKRWHRKRKSYICEICSKSFIRNDTLRRHLKIHSGQLDHECSFCGKGFNQVENLRTHVRIHTGEKPYICKTCGMSFAHNVSLKTHAKKHEKEDKRGN